MRNKNLTAEVGENAESKKRNNGRMEYWNDWQKIMLKPIIPSFQHSILFALRLIFYSSSEDAENFLIT